MTSRFTTTDDGDPVFCLCCPTCGKDIDFDADDPVKALLSAIDHVAEHCARGECAGGKKAGGR